MNATIERFGYPDTLIAEYDHWVVLLRPEQPTYCSLVLAAKNDAIAFADLEPAAFAEQARVIADIERALMRIVNYEKLNYLMLMMVDPHVHYHVIPRYARPRVFEQTEFADHGWPKVPQLAPAIALQPAMRERMLTHLKAVWQ